MAMKLRFLWIGKTRSAPIKELLDDYIERIRKYAGLEVIELRGRTAGTEKEGEDLISRIKVGSFVVALDERGVQLDSMQLAALIQKHRVAGAKEMAFIIGSHAGLADSVKKRADVVLSLSRMTLTHEFARAVLLEQVYRAFTIIHELPYQK